MSENRNQNCVKNSCNSCGWEGCYCEMLIDDRTFSGGIPQFICPKCKERNITYVKNYKNYIIPKAKGNCN